MEALQEEQEGKKGHEARREIVPEHSESQARLRHRIPGALDEMLVDVRKDVRVGVSNKAGLSFFF